MLIRDGIIREVGLTRRVENLAEARSAVEINAAGRVVMPGFVDSHTHLVCPAPEERDREDVLRHIRVSSSNLLRRRTVRVLETLARHGTTTVEAKTGALADAATEHKLLRVLASLSRAPLDLVPTVLAAAPPDGQDGGWEASLAAARRRRLAAIGDWHWEPDGDGPLRCARFFHTAGLLGFACKLHAPGPGIAAGVAAAVAGRAVSVDHVEHATEADAQALAASGAIATLLPAASFRNGERYAPARLLVETGVAISLASNFSPYRPSTLSMQAVVALACSQMGLSVDEAITAATFNAAHAVACSAETGSLEPGKRADILLLNTSDYRELAYHLGTNLVHMTIKRGQVIYQEGKVSSAAPKA